LRNYGQKDSRIGNVNHSGFHPHVNAAEQVERGLHGVLIVEDPEAPVYTQDLAWVLDDWLGWNNQIKIYSISGCNVKLLKRKW
jgi:FtsP/CotA-like multicopper oxidase with cupredoxin domain